MQSQSAGQVPVLSTHLSVLYESAARFSTSTVFRVPIADPATRRVSDWSRITYAQFLNDVEHYARYWRRTLRFHHVPEQSVVGMWYVLLLIITAHCQRSLLTS